MGEPQPDRLLRGGVPRHQLRVQCDLEGDQDPDRDELADQRRLDLRPPETTRVTGIVVFDPDPLFVGAPSSEAWHQDDVFRDLVALGGTGTTFWFSDPADSIWFNTWGVRYFSDKHKAIWVGTPAEAEFLVIRGPVPEGSTAGFALVKQYPLPYDGPLQLYQRL